MKLAGERCQVLPWSSGSFWFFISNVQTSVQVEFYTSFCMTARKLKMVKKEKTQKTWAWIHTISNAITRLLSICIAWTDWLCGFMHKLVTVQSDPNSSSAREQASAFSAPEERNYRRRRKERKHQIDWQGLEGAPSLFCSFTLLLCVCKKAITTERRDVQTGSKVYSVSAGHTLEEPVIVTYK